MGPLLTTFLAFVGALVTVAGIVVHTWRQCLANCTYQLEQDTLIAHNRQVIMDAEDVIRKFRREQGIEPRPMKLIAACPSHTHQINRCCTTPDRAVFNAACFGDTPMVDAGIENGELVVYSYPGKWAEQYPVNR